MFVRNIYVEYFFPTATPKHELKVARVISLIAKVGALAFVFGLRDQDAINLQLLGGVWILQTFPAVALGLFSTWLHRRGLLVGWIVGMVTGTLLVVSGGFSSVVDIGPDRGPIQLYAAHRRIITRWRRRERKRRLIIAILSAVIFAAADAIGLWALNQANPHSRIIFSDSSTVEDRPIGRLGQP